MHTMNEESQTHILGSTSLCSSLEDDAPLDAGSRLILAFNSMLYLALGIPLVCVLSLAVACGGVVCRSDTGLASTVLESIIYGIAASLCVRHMTRALHSKNLKLATGRLHAFVAEFKVDWREVSGQEGCIKKRFLQLSANWVEVHDMQGHVPCVRLGASENFQPLLLRLLADQSIVNSLKMCSFVKCDMAK